MPLHCNTPIQTSYEPELDITPELPLHEASYYMSLIGILRWIVELGRVDICLEVSMMSSYAALPQKVTCNKPFIYFLILTNSTILNWFLIPMIQLLMGGSLIGKIEHVASMNMSREKKFSQEICLHHVVLDLSCKPRSVLTMRMIQCQDSPGQDF